MPFELTTARMRLTRLRASHLPDLLALDSDPEVMRYISGGKPSTQAMYEAGLLDRMLCYDDKPYGFVAAYPREGPDTFMGWFHLRPSVADPQVLELGYRLARTHWGRGLATEGGRALVRYAFEDLDRDCVDACADPANLASVRVMEKCGMQAAGSFVHPRVPLRVTRYLVRR